jgi:hypothetical protein
VLAASRHEPNFVRTRVAFGCCNGWLGVGLTSAPRSSRAKRQLEDVLSWPPWPDRKIEFDG